MYKVLTAFVDSQDHGYVYRAGDMFPRTGKEVSRERLKELSSSNNRCNVALITEEGPKEGPSEAKEDTLDPKTTVGPSVGSESKEKPRKGQRRHDRTDSGLHT